MYFQDLFKRMGNKSNIPLDIYLVLNLVIISGVFYLLFSYTGNTNPFVSVGLGLGIYAATLAVSLSPVGEWCLRKQMSCNKIKNKEMVSRLYPLFFRVYEKALAVDDHLSENIRLYVYEGEDENAFATGRNTICVSTGLLRLEDEQIEAVIAHEFGHISHKDTDLALVISVGNSIINGMYVIANAIVIFFEFVCYITHIVGALIGSREAYAAPLMSMLYRVMFTVCVSSLMWLWTKLGTLLLMKSSRENEYLADAFAAELGYGKALCDALCEIDRAPMPKGFFGNLKRSHPHRDDRIEHLEHHPNFGTPAFA